MKISMFKAGAIACCCIGILMPLGCSSQEDIQAERQTENMEDVGANSISQRDIATSELESSVEAEESFFAEKPVQEESLEVEAASQEDYWEGGVESPKVGFSSGAARTGTGEAGRSRVDNSPAPDELQKANSSFKVTVSKLDSSKKLVRELPQEADGSGQAQLREQTAHAYSVQQGIDRRSTEHSYSVGTGEGQKFAGANVGGQGSGNQVGAASEKQEIDALVDGQQEHFNREAYDHIEEAPFHQVSDHPLSTFSIDVDTASYSNMRRFLTSGQLPPAGAVRIEELINYFSYDYPEPEGEEPFGTNVEIAAAPWNEDHRLVRIGLQGKKLHPEQRPGCNLVFLIDTSGSMRSQNKLPLVMQSMLLLAEQLEERDSVAIVTYAGSAGVRLPATSGENYEEIASSIHGLSAGGSTNGAGGITLAYQIARDNLIKDGVNRVILATDGDFNVGITNQSELTKLITDEAKSGVFLSVLGYGMGNYNDSTLEKLADQGNGNYAYIDTIKEANKVLREQLFGTLVTIAKDVKIQIEFNPATVSAYRLIGYENRLLKKEDFNDDKKDAGEIGAGHTVTALYEVVPAGVEVPTPKVDPLKYQKEPAKLTKAAKSDELLTLKLRYKAPDGDTSKLMEIPVKDSGNAFGKSTTDFQFAAAVASYGMKLRRSETISDMSLGGILEIAQSAVGKDESGYRGEFVELVKNSQQLLK